MMDTKKLLFEVIEKLEGMKDADKILSEAINTYGEEAQIDKAIEEMSELTKALLKYRLKPDSVSLENVIEEMADVSIMLDQLSLIYGDYGKKRIEKINRLATRLEEI